jgi:hypothetical protein
MSIVSFVGISAGYKSAGKISAEAVGKRAIRQQGGLAWMPEKLRTAYRIRSQTSELVSRSQGLP